MCGKQTLLIGLITIFLSVNLFPSKAGASTDLLEGAWIQDAYYEMEQGNFDIKAAVWFNENKETDWRIESSQSSLLGYQQR